jgi:hypothetical protein
MEDLMNYNEDTLTSKERKTIDDSQFGLPEERKYPLTDAAHVKSAMAYFRYCDADKKHALAKRILKAAKKYDVKVSEDSAVYKAAHEDADFMYTMNEGYYDNSRVILEADDDDFTNMLEDDDDDKKKKKEDTDNEEPENFSDITDAEDDNDTSFTDQADKDAESDAIENGDKNFTDLSDTEDDKPADEPVENQPTTTDEPQTTEPADNTEPTSEEQPAPDPDASGDDPGEFSDMGDTDQDPTDNPAGAGDTPEDGTDDSGDFSDMTDDGESAEGDQTADTATDTTQPATSGGDPELQELQQSAFSNLSEEQLRIRSNNIKQSFIDLHNDIVDLGDRLIVVNKNSDNIASVNFVTNSLNELKEMIVDAVSDSFDTRTLVENQVLLQRFIAHYGMLVHIIEKLPSKNKSKD